MDNKKFKEAESKYGELKLQLENGQITAAELKVRLKETMIQDDEGNYWMIGGKSGKWYRYNGTEWAEDRPYVEEAASVATHQFSPPVGEDSTSEESEETVLLEEEEPERKVVDPVSARPQRAEIFLEDATREETTAETDDGQVLCKFCKSRIPAHATYCEFCGGNQKSKRRSPATQPIRGESELLIKSIKPIPFLFFFGGLGLILGVLIGATFGIFNVFGDLIYQFPLMLQETRGKIQGGLIFAAMGGIAGFISFAAVSVIGSAVYNAISYFFGGIRFRVRS